MKTENLERNDLSPGGFVWFRKYAAALDAGDLDDFCELISEDCVLHINNEQWGEGKSAIRARLAPLWESFRGVQHDLLSILGNDQQFALEARHQHRHRDSVVDFRAVTITDRDMDGDAESIRVYFDTAPFREGGR